MAPKFYTEIAESYEFFGEFLLFPHCIAILTRIFNLRWSATITALDISVDSVVVTNPTILVWLAGLPLSFPHSLSSLILFLDNFNRALWCLHYSLRKVFRRRLNSYYFAMVTDSLCRTMQEIPSTEKQVIILVAVVHITLHAKVSFRAKLSI